MCKRKAQNSFSQVSLVGRGTCHLREGPSSHNEGVAICTVIARWRVNQFAPNAREHSEWVSQEKRQSTKNGDSWGFQRGFGIVTMPLTNAKVNMCYVLQGLLTFVVSLSTVRTLREISILDFAIQSKGNLNIFQCLDNDIRRSLPMLFNQCAIATFDRIDGVNVNVAVSRCHKQAHHLLNATQKTR